MDNPTILYLDDEEKLLNAFKRLFIEENYNIITALNGEEGLKILKNEKVDIIMADQRMSGMQGLEILKEAKKTSPRTVRIMTTGFSDIAVTIAAINEGEIQRYITKPWDNDQLKGIIRDILNRKQQQAAETDLAVAKRIEWQIRDLTYALRRASFATVQALSNAIELKDKYTKGHCDRVLKYALLIADKLDLSADNIAKLKYAAILHDIGKIGVPALILNKTEKLNDAEWEIIKEHPRSGANIVLEIDFLKGISRIILEHHERIDGQGYPYGKKKEVIRLESRIIAIADVFDALTTDRPYRKAFTHEKAVDILVEGRGSQFDEQLVDIFIEEIKKQQVL